jgi:hypothetical protein
MNIRTCGIDVFDWGVEYLIVDWIDEDISKTIASGKIHGDFQNEDFQKRLKKLLKLFKVDVTAIDSGGHKTQYIYDFCKKYKKVFAIKGVIPDFDKIIQRKANASQALIVYLVAIRNAKRKIVDMNIARRETSDILAFVVIAKEIAKDIASLK